MNGVDLDLTYVTKQIIAMSFPSQGILSWYRNSIREAIQKTFEAFCFGDRVKIKKKNIHLSGKD